MPALTTPKDASSRNNIYFTLFEIQFSVKRTTSRVRWIRKHWLRSRKKGRGLRLLHLIYLKDRKTDAPYRFYRDICQIAAECDIRVICCRLNDQTCRVIMKDVLKALGKDGIVVNISRGAVIDEKELVRCLVEGEIGGAGSDVFENEPNVPKEW